MGKIYQILNLSKVDPDTPTLTKAMTWPYKAECMQAMTHKVKEMEQHGNLTIVSINSVTGAHILRIT